MSERFLWTRWAGRLQGESEAAEESGPWSFLSRKGRIDDLGKAQVLPGRAAVCSVRAGLLR